LEFSEQGSHVIPLLIELRSLDKILRAEDMLVTRLSRLGQDRIEPAQLAYMAEAGHLLILFDGYDELALRVNFDRAADHLATITSAARGKAIVVLTCRTQHFATDHQMLLKLFKQEGLFRAKLLPFTELQIREFLTHKLGSTDAAEKRFELIQEIKDLLGLSQNPRMLSFIADLPDKDLADAQSAAPDGKITAAGLYETILDRWLRNEVERHSHLQRKDANLGQSPAPTSISDKQYLEELWEAVTRLAFLAWGRMERPFEIHEIQQTLGEIPRNLMDVTLSPDERTQGIASGSLLSREAPGQFAFAHYSIPEFLVARELVLQFRPNDQTRKVFPDSNPIEMFSQEVVTDLMVEFLIDGLTMQGALQAVSWMLNELAGKSTEEQTRKNIDVLTNACSRRLKKSGTDAEETAATLASLQQSSVARNYDRMDLRGRTFSNDCSRCSFVGADLRQSSFRGIQLEEARFESARLAEADLSRCNLRRSTFLTSDLTGANLSYADLRYADLTGANLTRATLIGADLRGAVLTDSQWDLARIAGATLDDPHLTGLAAFGAGLPVVIPTPEMQPEGSSVTCVAWAPRHDLIATAHANGNIVLWDVERGEELRAFKGHSGDVLSASFWEKPGGTLLLVSSSTDGTIRIWNANNGGCLGILMAHDDSWAALRPDGRYRVVGDMKQYLWHVSGLARYELGELDAVYPDLKLAEAEPLIPAMYFQ